MIDLCIDSALDLALFNDDRCPTQNGQCSKGYKLHPILNDLCILEHMLVDLKYGQIADAQQNKSNNIKLAHDKSHKEYKYPPSRAVTDYGAQDKMPKTGLITIGLGL